MSEWWTYRPSDFLLFSARTYYRLFEIHNAAIWPGQLLALALGVCLLWLAWRGGVSAARAACAIVGIGWLFTGAVYFLWRYATINWAATWFGATFILEAVLWIGLASSRACPALRARTPGAGLSVRARIGIALLIAGIAWPALAPLLGRAAAQAEVFGLTPDPTAIGTLGVLLLFDSGPERRLPPLVRKAWFVLLWTMPVAWCLLTGITLWTLQAPEAIIVPLLAGIALAASRLEHRPATS